MLWTCDKNSFEKKAPASYSYLRGLKQLACPKWARGGDNPFKIEEAVDADLDFMRIHTTLSTDAAMKRTYLACMTYYRHLENKDRRMVAIPEMILLSSEKPLFGTMRAALELIFQQVIRPNNLARKEGKAPKKLVHRLEMYATLFFKFLYFSSTQKEGIRVRDTDFVLRQFYQDSSAQHVDDFDFRCLFKLDLDLVLHICRAILLEKKIIIIKKDTQNLAEIIQALLSLVQPFSWNFPVIADLPRSMLEALEGVQPFIIGIERDLWLSDCVVQRMDNRGEENFAICDMDSGESRGLQDLYDDGTPHVLFP